MLKRFSWIPGVVLAVGMAHVQAQTTVPGKLPGEFTVSPSGAAIYRIPIEVPPGVAGMQPQLALSYSSQAGNGVMGLGWSIDGLSAITRCARTMATDGVRGGVNLDAEDRFCLDGQRLINVSGAYGAANSEYRTELESFSRITAYGAAAGNAANGPERFTVQTKAGLTMEYGATADSRIEAQGRSVVRVWALNRMSDARGNAIHYGYIEDHANGQYLISGVSYAGNEVKFAYEERPDRFTGYQVGSKVSQTLRLKQIQVRHGNILHRQTNIEYLATDSPTEKSRPASLTHCTAAQQCLAPLTLIYPARQLTAFEHREFVAGDGPHFSTQSVDINGDGRSDVVLWHPYAGSFMLQTKSGDGSGQFGRHQLSLGYSVHGDDRSTNFVDINGDGKPDFLYRFFSTVTVRPPGSSWDSAYQTKQLNIGSLIGDGQGNFGAHALQQTMESGDHHSIAPADLTGDGKTDLVHMISGPLGISVKASIGNGAGSFSAVETSFGSEKPGYIEGPSSSTPVLLPAFQLGDINGDGVLDLVYWYGVSQRQLLARARLGDGTGRFGGPMDLPISSMSFHAYSLLGNSFTQSSGLYRKSINVELTDINGDGVADLMEFIHDPNRGFVIRARIGDGKGNFGLVETLNGSTSYFANRKVLDMNGDGFADIVYWYFDDARGLVVHLKLGDGAGGFGHQEIVLQDGKSEAAHNVEFADIDGNGIPDLLYWFYDAARGLVLRSKVNSFNDGGRLREIVQSGQVVVSVEYESLSGTANLHTRDDTGAYPMVDLQSAIQVVSATSQPNGAGGLNRTTYSYGGLKAEYASAQHPGSGRGMLGFRWMKSLEEATGIETYTEFSQTWPTIGQITRSETRLTGAGNGGLLKQTTHAHGCHQSHAMAGTAAPASATAPCGPWAPGKVYFPYLQSAVEDSWDIDGTAMPRLSITQIYAGYAEEGSGVRQFGDPTQVRVDIHQGGVLHHRKDTANEYHPARTMAGQWQLGRLKKASVTSSQY